MNKYKILSYLLLFILLSGAGCSKTMLDNSKYGNLLPEVNEPKPPLTPETLKDKTGWVIDTLDKGLIHYQFANYVQTQTANQLVNVVEVDLNNPEYELQFVSLSSLDTLSSVAKNYDAVIGINGTYEIEASFIKTNGNVVSPVTLDSGHLRFWKHEGAIFYNSGQDAKIEYGTKESYLQSPYLNMFSGSPMLIDNYKKVGEDFMGDLSCINLNSLEPGD